MSIKTVSDCVGCDPCIGCRRGRKRKAVICDSCDQEIEDKAYYSDFQHLCEECYLDKAYSRSVEEVLYDTC